MTETSETTHQPSIAVIGGGTGSYTLLKDLKNYTPELTAIVNMSDDGGSTGRLRDELGVLPPGDVRQCLVALSECSEAREMFEHRFGGQGELSGHSLGNLILAGIEEWSGDFMKAIRHAGYLLRITGKVVPVTVDKHDLVMRDGDETVRGEFNIGHRAISSPNHRVYHDPPVRITTEAHEAIAASDLVVIAPGNLYGSIIPALAVGGVAESLQANPARKLMVANLVNKPGQTDGWSVTDYAQKVEEYVGEGTLDAVLFNQTPVPTTLLGAYARQGELPTVVDELQFNRVRARMFGRHLLADSVYEQNGNDTAIQRTLIRHDGNRVAASILEVHKLLQS